MTKQSDQNKTRKQFLERALLEIADEDARGFRALVAQRHPSYELLERRGLIYRSRNCIPERCAYRIHHGPTPSGDCGREGWLLSLRGRLAIEAFRNGMTFDHAVGWASTRENRYAATTVIHERVSDDDKPVIIGTDLPRPTKRRQGGRLAALIPPPSGAERAAVGQLERMAGVEKLIGDMIQRLQAARVQMRAADAEVRALKDQLGME